MGSLQLGSVPEHELPDPVYPFAFGLEERTCTTVVLRRKVKQLHTMHRRNRGDRREICLVMGNFGSIFVMPSANLTIV